MNRKTLSFTVGMLSAFALLAGASAFAQRPLDVHFSGALNDYSPSTVKGGPWEMHGTWSLDLHGASGRANFTAAMTMSGYGKTAAGAVDPTQAGQGAHTHNIELTNASVTWNMTGCPVYSPATVQICVTGGELVPYSMPYSNISLVFEGPATTHFGTQAIHGDVRTLELVGGFR